MLEGPGLRVVGWRQAGHQRRIRAHSASCRLAGDTGVCFLPQPPALIAMFLVLVLIKVLRRLDGRVAAGDIGRSEGSPQSNPSVTPPPLQTVGISALRHR